MSDVFISYAREDRAFVRRLHDALAQGGRDSWVDWEGIPASAKWMAEVRSAIDRANAFSFVISPDSVESPVCREEVAHAAAGNKRILPILHRPVGDELIPDSVAAHNWIDFSEQADFDAAFTELVHALETDLEHLRNHTRLLVRAKEWEEAGNDSAFLLRGDNLRQAESWLELSQAKQPAPTQLHSTYVLASRKHASHRQRRTTVAVAAALAVSVALSAVALIQRSQAREAESRAQRQADLATSRSLSGQALADLESGNLDQALLLATQAWRTHPTVEARGALLAGLQRSEGMISFLHDGTPGAPSAIDVAFSPDGSILAAARADGTIALWNVADRSILGAPVGADHGPVGSIAFTPNGSQVAAGYLDGTVAFLDVSTLRFAPDPIQADSFVRSLAFSPDGRWLAIVTDQIRLWELRSMSWAGRLRPFGEGAALNVSFSPDGSMVAGADFDASFWDPATRQPLARLPGRTNHGYSAVAFGPDGTTFATAGGDGVVKIWDVRTLKRVGQALTSLGRTPGSSLSDVAFSPDGKRVAAAGSDGALVWELGPEYPVAVPVTSDKKAVNSVAFDPSGSVLAVGGDDDVTLWDPALRGITVQAKSVTDATGSLVVNPDGSVATTTFIYPEDAVFLSDGSVATTWNGGPIELWDSDGQLIDRLEPRSRRIDIDARPTRLAFTAGESVGVYDVATGRSETFPADVGELRDIALASSNVIVAGEHVIGSWDLDTQRRPMPLIRPGFGTIYAIDLSPDGSRVAVGSEDGGAVIDLAQTPPVVHELALDGSDVLAISFSPDGALIATGGDDGLVLWRVADRSRVGEAMGSEIPVVGVAFSPDGSLIAAVRWDTSAVIWDTATRRALGDPLIQGPPFEMSSGAVAFSPSGRRLALGPDGLTIWNFDTESWVERACAIANRNLSRQDWAVFVGPTVPYEPTCEGLRP